MIQKAHLTGGLFCMSAVHGELLGVPALTVACLS